MFRSLSIAATGMEAQQLNIDITSNNLANVNTSGFKRSRADFQDLLYQTVRAAGSPAAQGVETPTGLQVGLGTRAAAASRLYTTGDMQQTGNPLDLAIEGAGFFEVTLPNGQLGYTRAGSFALNSQGQLVTGDGYLLNPAITLPPNPTNVTIGSDGTVSVKLAGQDQVTQVGQILISNFPNPAGLEAMGRNIFLPTTASGVVASAPAGDAGAGLGTLAQGMLEGSNVQVVDEMIGLITAQRAYELNSRVVSTVDQMLRQVTQMR